jgi:hypothetical protein
MDPSGNREEQTATARRVTKRKILFKRKQLKAFNI